MKCRPCCQVDAAQLEVLPRKARDRLVQVGYAQHGIAFGSECARRIDRDAVGKIAPRKANARQIDQGGREGMRPVDATERGRIVVLAGEVGDQHSLGTLDHGAGGGEGRDLVRRAELVIDLDVALIVVVEAAGICLIVIGGDIIRGRGIGQGVILRMRKEVGGHRIHDRQALIARIRGEAVLCVVEVASSGREIAVAHSLGHHAGRRQATRMMARSQVIDKEEHLAVQEGTAEGTAELRLRVWRDRDDGVLMVVPPRVGVEAIVLHVAIGRTVEQVGAALEHEHHAGAVRVAKVGRRIGGDHLDLFEGLGRGGEGHPIVLGFVHVDAVQRVVVGLGAVAIDVGRIAGSAKATVWSVAADVRHRSGSAGVDRARHIQRNGREIQAVQRQVLDGVGGEGA